MDGNKVESPTTEKKITLNVGRWIGAANSLGTIIATNLPARTAFKLARLLNKISPIVQEAEKQRHALVTKLGDKSEDGDQISVTKENQETFQKEWIEITKVEESIDFNPIPLAELGNAEISTGAMVNLAEFFAD